MFLGVRNLNKVFKSSLFFHRGIKIQEGCQPCPITSATELCYIINYNQTGSTVVNKPKQIALFIDDS